MTLAKTNYGTLLNRENTPGGGVYTVIAEIVNLDPPELMNPAVEVTNHSSGGNKEFVSGGLKELSEFKVNVNFIGATMSGILGDCVNGTVRGYQIEFPNDTTEVWKFDALVIGIKPAAADAQSPDDGKFDITFRPTGVLTTS